MSAQNSKPQAIAKSGIVVPHKPSLLQRFAASAIYVLAKILMATWRCESSSKGPLVKAKGPVIFCVWHNRLAISMVAYFRYAKELWPAPGLAAMISASKDGGLLAAVLEKFGVQAVRGSSSRRGRQALLESTSWIEKSYNIAITPDGPRGPCYEVQDGIISLAQISGVPIVTVSAVIRGKILLRSWDKFQIPLPFAKCTIVFGDIIHVPRDISDEEKERLRERLRREMLGITMD
jgi:lysophospholipid acyltransferase (LPLAT)-like uncharacterized protein